LRGQAQSGVDDGGFGLLAFLQGLAFVGFGFARGGHAGLVRKIYKRTVVLFCMILNL
jgi:hypothetical protein